MTDEQWTALKPYAKAHARASLALSVAGMRNAPLDPRERAEATGDYARLRIEEAEARRAYDEQQRLMTSA